MQNSRLFTVILACITVMITAFILTNGFKNRNEADDVINVVGLGTVDFTSDEILWFGNFTLKAPTAQEAYMRIVEDQQKVKQFFLDKGFKEGDFKFGGSRVDKAYRTISTRNENTGYETTETVFDGYTANQSVTFTAKQDSVLMNKIETVSNQTSELIPLGIEFYSNPLQYTYSQLPSLKYNLIEKATEDAKERAEKIIRKGNGRKGKLKNATMGVFQITGVGSNDEDSYGGNFDVYNKQKTARITVRLTYNLD